MRVWLWILEIYIEQVYQTNSRDGSRLADLLFICDSLHEIFMKYLSSSILDKREEEKLFDNRSNFGKVDKNAILSNW